MLICPKCRNEYRDGIEVCADCGCQLVEEAADGLIPFACGEEKQIMVMKKYFEYNKLKDVKVEYNPKLKGHEIFVRKEDAAFAAKLAQVMLHEQAKEAYEKAAQTNVSKASVIHEAEDKTATADTTKTETNVSEGAKLAPDMDIAEALKPSVSLADTSERAADNRSSAWTLLFVGGLGLLFTVLSYFEIIPFYVSGSSRYIVYGLMVTLFVIFVVMGFVSFKSAKAYALQAASGKVLIDEMKVWSKEHFTAENIDEGLAVEGVAEEELFFRRAAKMKYILKTQFPNADEKFLDGFIDEIYDDIY